MKKKDKSVLAALVSEAIEQSRELNKPWCDGILEIGDVEVEIDGFGPIPLPMRPADVRKLREFASQAPYGKGTKTLVDVSVRNSLEVDASKVQISTKLTQAIDAAILDVAQKLNLESDRLATELYKLLIYPKGGFFLPHRDSEKSRGMVATMVVVLPSRFGGGGLILEHGRHRECHWFELASKEQHTQFTAFYADCRHEVTKVTSGVRVCLAFNLLLKPQKKTRQTKGSVDSPLQRQVLAWTEHRPADPLLFALEHQYTKDGLSSSRLKGNDRELFKNVSAVANAVDCHLFFGQVERHLCQSAFSGPSYDEWETSYEQRDFDEWSGDCDDLEIEGVIYDTITVDGWKNADGKRAQLADLACESSQLISFEPVEDWIPTEKDYEGYTGNAGNTLDRWYHKSVIAIWPAANHFDILAQMRLSFAIKQWNGMLAKLKKLKSHAARESSRDNCIRLAEAIVRAWPNRVHAYRRHDSDLRSNLDDFASALPSLEDLGLIDSFLDVLANCDWTTDLKKLVVGSLQKIEVDDIFPLLERLIEFEPEPNEYGVRFLEGLAVRDATWLLQLAQRKKYGGLSIEQLQALLLTAIGKLTAHVMRIQEEDKYRRSDPPDEAWLVLCKALIAIEDDAGLAKTLQLTKDCPRVFDLRGSQVPAAVTLLGFAAKRNGEAPVSLMKWSAKLRAFLAQATAAKPKPPADFRRDSVTGCNCKFCHQLKSFLENATQKKTLISAAERHRGHLEMVINRQSLDVKTKTVRTGTPYSLELTKTKASHETRVQKYRADLKLLEQFK